MDVGGSALKLAEMASTVATVAETASTLAEKVVEPMRKQVSYAIQYKRKIDDLTSKVENLTFKKQRVNQSVEAAKRNLDPIDPEVESWLSDAEQTIARKDENFGEERLASAWCFNGWCPNPKSRYSLGKCAEEMSLVVDDLLQKDLPTVSYPAPPPGRLPSVSTRDVTMVPGASTSAATQTIAFESRTLMIEDVMDALEGEEFNPIVICGMGGIGKTTMLKVIYDRTRAESLFKEFAWVNVTRTPDSSKIQNDIAEFLGLKEKFSRLGSEEIRKEMLCERLSRSRVLVILDDVWNTEDLKDIGLPLFSNSCKILISSRSQAICSWVQTRKNFPMKLLNDLESWSLFTETAGSSIESPELRHIAEQVLNECGNLPIAISTVGRALHGKKQFHIWNDALRQLKEAIPENIPGVIPDVYRQIEYSYKSLASEELKLCFLLCCVYPEGRDISIENLVKHGLGLGLFKNRFGESINLVEARDSVKALIDGLKSCFLLLDSSEQGCVRMHDVMRDVALFIASPNFQQKKTSQDDQQIRLFVRHGVEVEGWPIGEYISSEIITNGTTHQNAAKVTGMNSELLLLSCTGETMEPPETILTKREKLKVLDFKKTDISLILPMLPLLENLQTLCLENCVLGDVSMIGKLRKLLILKLSGSSIKELPESFRNLSNLWLLDLTGCSIEWACPSGVISRLAKLQELRMRISWQDRPESFVRYRVVLDLLSLCNLKVLEVDLPSIIDLDEYLQKGYKLLDGLERFQISVKPCLSNSRPHVNTSTDSDWNRDFKPSENFLKLDSDWNSLHRSSISLLLKKTDTLQLSLKNLREPLNVLDGGHHLVAVLISLSLNESDDALEYVIDMTTSAVNDVLFPVLVSLTMNESGSLRRICNGVPPVGSFKELRRVEVSSCDGLISLLPLSVARELHQLEEVCIRDCSMLEEIVTFEGQAQEEKALTEMRLPSLTHLNLANLPEFVGMSKNVRLIISFHLLFTVKLENLPKLISLHPNDSAPESSSNATIKHLFDAKDGSFLELRFIDVIKCNAVTSVFSSDSMQSLQNLERLNVKECLKLKTLFDFECLDVRPGRASTLSCIDRMELINLPQLEYIWKPHPKIQAFQNLRFLKVHSCETLKHVFPIYVAEGLLQLESLDTSQCGSMKDIFCGNDGGETISNRIVRSQVKALELTDLKSLQRFCAAPWILEFPSLRSLVLRHLHKLKTALSIAVFHSPSQILNEKVVSNSVQNLQQLEVRNCSSLERLFHFELGLDNKLEDISVALSCLEKMELIYLRNLKYLWEPFPKTLAFRNLKSLQVASCEKLRFVFPVSTAKSLVKLQSIHVEICGQMKEVLAEVDGEENEIVFPEMQSLSLVNLNYLQSFYPASRTLEWPSLIKLVLIGCYRMATFVPESNSYNLAAHDFYTYLFNEKVNFPSLKTLKLRSMNKIKEIWSNRLVPTTFCELVELQVSECHKLSLLLPLYMQDRLKKLESLTVETCDSLQDIFEFRGLHSNNGNALTITQQREAPVTLQLEKMKIEQTPSFQHLTSISVSSCCNLRYLLPSSLAVSLRNLKKLSISECVNIEEIVLKPAEADEAEDYIVFPQLSDLTLSNLPNLMSFSGGNYTLDWRSVELYYFGCPEIRGFSYAKKKLGSVNADNKGSIVWKGDLKGKVN